MLLSNLISGAIALEVGAKGPNYGTTTKRRVFACVPACAHTHTYTHTYIYTHIYTYIHTHPTEPKKQHESTHPSTHPPKPSRQLRLRRLDARAGAGLPVHRAGGGRHHFGRGGGGRRHALWLRGLLPDEGHGHQVQRRPEQGGLAIWWLGVMVMVSMGGCLVVLSIHPPPPPLRFKTNEINS